MAAKKKATTAVAKKEEAALAVVDGYEEFAGDGFDNVKRSDLQIPFLNVLQALSDQVKSVAKGGLEGAEVGSLHNSVTDDLYPGDTGVGLVPAITQHKFVEWRPRDEGGGIVNVFDPEDAVVKKCQGTQKFGELKTDAGNDLVETFYLFGVLFDLETEEYLGTVCVPFASTKIGAYKRITTSLYEFLVAIPTEGGGTKKINPPMYAHRLKVTTVEDSNKKGDFANIKVTPANGGLKDGLLPAGSELWEAAKALKDSVAKGEAQANYDSAGGGGTDSADDDDDGHF